MQELQKTYKIMIVGEAWGEHEEVKGEHFVGPPGYVLRGMLKLAGLPIEDCYLTNVFNLRPADNKLESLCGHKSQAIQGWPPLGARLNVLARYQSELDRLWLEIETVKPNVILALGATPLWAICKKTGIKKYRGTPMLSFDGKWKVLPTYHPAAIMRQWKLRPIAIADIGKLIRESASPRLVRPTRHIWLEPTLDDIELFYNRYIRGCEVLSCDIETKQGTITEIGFSPREDKAIVIPFYKRQGNPNYWQTLTEEVAAWRWVERILAEHPQLGQNFSYDFQYLWGRMGIRVPVIADDTMILHHAMYPEMEKSLGFLGSVYTDEPSWKFMRTDHDNFKRED